MKCAQLFLFLYGLFLSSVSSRHVQFYRKDYTYVEKFNAYYKVHWDLNGQSWNSAFLACDDEGSTLFYPKEKEEWSSVKNLTSTQIDTSNVTEIFVGIHNEFSLGEFLTVDGQSTPYPLLGEEQYILGPDNCVLLNIETGQYRVSSCLREPEKPLPFVCKKVDDEFCPTIDRDYKFSRASRKCYKVNNKPKMWQEAMQTCFMEGGILAVIENKAQADFINDMTESETSYFFGVRKLVDSGDYYTVKGQKFSDIYERGEDTQGCGVAFKRNGIVVMTATCSSKLPFICELELNV